MHPDRHYTHTHIGKLFQAVSTQAPEGDSCWGQFNPITVDAVLPVIAIQDSLTLLDALLDVKAVQNSLIPVITNYALLTVMAFQNYLTL